LECEENSSSSSGDTGQKHLGESDQTGIGGATGAKVGQTFWYAKVV